VRFTRARGAHESDARVCVAGVLLSTTRPVLMVPAPL
jgi:hypothetical protein